MAFDDIQRLRSIKTFPSLVKYLRDELDWPIESDDTEELTFEYDPEELGIDPKTAAKIQEIKQLRPMDTQQPWGIFFVKFEPKHLPVVVLRKILNQLVIKKRVSSGKSTQAAWKLHDLLFISSYGEHEERQITFAHFTQDLAGKDLPTLRVLGWDGRDTLLHIDEVVQTLKTNFRWPQNFNANEVRERWSSAFAYRYREAVTTASGLAERLAVLASRIRDQVLEVMSYETEKGAVRQLYAAFRTGLIHDLEPKDFADMYAQTIAYGLLSARIADPTKTTLDDFAAHMRTNPFLRELMETFLRIGGRKGKAGGPGIDFDELGVSEVVALLDEANMEAVVRDFGDRNPTDDPVIHFYEHFLAAYDKRLKVSRGVFYTPQPVVSYIVRSVHSLLRTEFGLEDGLADTTTWGEMLVKHPNLKLPPLTNEPGEKRSISPDEPFVQILDPATGTATFLVEVIEVIHQTLRAKWKQQRLTEPQLVVAWNDYVPQHLLPRLHAFELMMAPYAIAHMKIGLKLTETGYRFGTEERARIYLTNALEPWMKQPPLIGFDALAHEATAVNEVKKFKRFTVVIGNPPYSGLSANMSEEAGRIIEPYKYLNGVHFGERKHWLHDDYVKFFRLSETRVNEAGAGVLGLITNHAFYDNPTFNGMRWNLLQSFDHLRLLDLHGNTMKRERNPTGGEDKNVFDIQQGVAISLFSKLLNQTQRMVTHGELWGTRDQKYAALSRAEVDAISSNPLTPSPTSYFFVPRMEENAAEYENSLRLNEIFEVFAGGFITARDHFVIDLDRTELLARIKAFADPVVSDAKIRETYFAGCGSDKYPDGDTRGWKVPEARRKIRADTGWDKHVCQCLYRPFDVRWIYWTEGMVDWTRPEANGHLLNKGNIALAFMRQAATGDGYSHFLVSRLPVDNRACYSNKGIMTLAPLYLHEKEARRHAELLFKGTGNRTNFTPAFTTALRAKLGDATTTLIPEDIFYYAYAVFHSPSYRNRYAEFLKTDFPRLPLTANLDLFHALAKIGGQITALHLMESPTLSHAGSKFIGSRNSEVEKISWSRNTVWVNKAQTTGFHGVLQEVWNFQIGGYQVCEKWLKDRKGRLLAEDDIKEYQKIVIAISETIRLMAEVDEVIERHGGWPGAFAK